MKKSIIVVLLLLITTPLVAYAAEEKVVVSFTMEELLDMDKGIRSAILHQAELKKKTVSSKELTMTEPEVVESMVYEEFKHRVSSIVDAINDLLKKLGVTINELLRSPAGILAALGLSHRYGLFSSAWRTVLVLLNKQDKLI
jgi:hypothetical protein